MSELVIVLVLAFVAGILAAVEVTRTRGQDLGAWAVLALAVAIVVDRL